MKRFVIVSLVLLAFLHQDFWFWDRIEPLVLGFVPIGLAYQIGVSIVAAILWALAVRVCWPRAVDVPDDVPRTPAADTARARSHS